MGYASSLGVCFAAGFSFSFIHRVLPFIFLGIGVDDMFVIVQSLRTIDENEKSIRDRFGICLKEAGVSICITTLTDLIAFGLGSFSSIPVLRSFCVFAAVGIAFVFLYMNTFFLGCLVIDQKRKDAFKAICCKNKENNNFFLDFSPSQYIFNLYSSIISINAIKMTILTASFAALGATAWGASQLSTEFDDNMLVPEGTDLWLFRSVIEEQFKSVYGIEGSIYVSAEIESFEQELERLKHFSKRLHKLKFMSNWYNNEKNRNFIEAYSVSNFPMKSPGR